MTGVTEACTDNKRLRELALAAETCTLVIAAGHAHLGRREPDTEK